MPRWIVLSVCRSGGDGDLVERHLHQVLDLRWRVVRVHPAHHARRLVVRKDRHRLRASEREDEEQNAHSSKDEDQQEGRDEDNEE